MKLFVKEIRLILKTLITIRRIIVEIGIVEIYEILGVLKRHSKELETINFRDLSRQLRSISETVKKNYQPVLEIIDAIRKNHTDIIRAIVILHPVIAEILETIQKKENK